MGQGAAPAAAVDEALAADAGRLLRQVHAVDRLGRSAAWTGRNCVAWCGAVTGEHVSVAGNMLAGPTVIAATFDALTEHAACALPERLLAALDGGQGRAATGGESNRRRCC